MDTRADVVRAIVRFELPALGPASIRPLGGGQQHVAYEVDGRFVVRLGIDGDDDCAARVEREVALLDVVERISPLAVPQPLFVVPERCCYGYHLLSGVPLQELAPEARAQLVPRVAPAIGEFLAALHAMPVAELAALAPSDLQPPSEWLRDAAELYAAVAAHMPAPSEDAAVRAFLETPPPATSDEPVFSHNDLGIEHILVNPEGGGVTGVIDWSDAAICDRAYDFGLLLRDLGPAALDAAFTGYTVDPDVPAITERAWFYARCAAIEDLAYGLETGRDEYMTKSRDALPWLFAPGDGIPAQR